MNMEGGLAALFKEISANIQVLGLAGLAGAITKAVVAPEAKWRRRLAQGVAGAACAIFLGPIVANMLTGFVDQEVYAWLAAGFVCGYGGETIVSLLQNKFLGTKK